MHWRPETSPDLSAPANLTNLLTKHRPAGTGAFDLLLNESMLEQAVAYEPDYGEAFGGFGPGGMTPGRATPGWATPGRCAGGSCMLLTGGLRLPSAVYTNRREQRTQGELRRAESMTRLGISSGCCSVACSPGLPGCRPGAFSSALTPPAPAAPLPSNAVASRRRLVRCPFSRPPVPRFNR